MLAVIFEILAVIFGTIALFVPKLLNPNIKFSKWMVSRYSNINNCKLVYKLSLSLCFIANAVALFFYIGPIGLLFLINLIAVFTDPDSKVHSVAFIGFILYGLASIIHNPFFSLNYIPLAALGYLFYSFTVLHSNYIGLILLNYSAAALMLINILVVG